ncbi:MAG: Na+/H+ antiporter NhaA, partial [Clostridiales Family XIII bacterium]|nr:Na+/H+ antiporter NhaA [Clostridiales Family XIII bacterium]
MKEESHLIIHKIREYSIPLIIGVVVSIVWKNLSPESYDTVVFTPIFGEHIDLHFLVNDVFMVFFFAVAGIEIVHSLMPGGVLFPVKRAVLPLMSTLGGVLGPVIVFFALNTAFGSADFVSGWGICTATDIALSWLLARIIFGAHHPAVNFLLLLAVADDGIGMFVIAVFYPDPNVPAEYGWLLLIAAGMGVAYILRRLRVRNWAIYVFCAGILSWIGLYNAHLHPALALIFIVPFIPASEDRKSKSELEGGARTHELLAIDRCKNSLSPFVDFGLIFFGITNAGVQFSAISSLTWIVCISLIVGKTLGIVLFSRIATLLSFKPPEHVGFKETCVIGLIAGAGLTVALFVAGVAFTDQTLQISAKMGALFSSAVFVIAPLLSKALKIKRIDVAPNQPNGGEAVRTEDV